MLKKSLLSEKGISLLTALIFNLVTLLVGVAWLKFAVNSALSTTKIRIEKTQNDYLLKGFNSLIDVQATSMDFFKTKFLADFEVRYNPSQFFPKLNSLKSLDKAVLEVQEIRNFEDYVIRSKIFSGNETVTSITADNLVSNCNGLARFSYLTDCERQRQEFVPPDSTNCIPEDCGASDRFLIHQGPNRFDGDIHTNDSFFFGSVPSVSMLGCVTASCCFPLPPPISFGNCFQNPPPPLAGVTFFDDCNFDGSVIFRPKVDFGKFPSDLIADAVQSGFYSKREFENQVQRVVFHQKGFGVYSSNKQLLSLLGPNAWNDERQYPYSEIGAIFFETDVFVSGLVNSNLTVGSCGNIYIDDDLKYSVTDSTGLNYKDSSGLDSYVKLGLISCKNVLLETRHIATNKGFSWNNFDSTFAHNNHQEGVIVNAGILALGESFGAYSANFPSFVRFPGDEYGGISNPKFPLLGNHGTVNFLGSIAQKRRGIINHGTRGGYGGTLMGTGATGPQIVRVYDERFYCNPPKYFPKLEQNLSLVVR